LQSTGAGTLTVSSDGPFQLPTAVASGTAYTVSIRTQPTNPSQTCAASGATASGIVSGGNVTNVEINCTAAANAARFVYVTNRGSNDISGYRIDNATGALTAMNGSPFPAGVSPTWLTVHPSGNFAYVSNDGANSIAAYAIDATNGGLTPIGGAPVLVRPFASVEYPISPVVIDPSGNLAIVGNSNAPIVGDAQPDNLAVYHIDAASGALAPVAGSPFSTNSPFDEPKEFLAQLERRLASSSV
jgi:6-phosphogluconolactonase (cycloisomerase 2 family)